MIQARSQPSRGGGGGSLTAQKGTEYRVGWCVCVWGGGYYYSEWSGGGGVVRTPRTPLATGLVISTWGILGGGGVNRC